MFDPLPAGARGGFLSDAIYRWRGIGEWSEAEATVWCCNWVPDQENTGGWYNVTFSYRGNGEMQQGTFGSNAPETSSPYFRGDTFTLRYNPKHPSRYYIAGERTGRLQVVIAIGLGMAAALIVLLMNL